MTACSFARLVATRTRQPVRYYRVQKDDVCYVMEFATSWLGQLQMRSTQLLYDGKLPDETTFSYGAPVLAIVDGIHNHLDNDVMRWLRRAARAAPRRVFLSSGNYSYKRKIDSEAEPQSAQVWEMPPWTEQDLMGAVNSLPERLARIRELDPDFANMAADDIVREKFYYAGSSARWFFRRDKAAIQTSVKEGLQGVAVSGAVSIEEAANITNRLCHNLLFTSKYVAKLASAHQWSAVDAHLVQVSADLNACAQGWIFEYRVIQYARRQKMLKLSFEGQEETFSASKDLDFWDVADMAIDGDHDTAFIFPLRFNQGAFDLIHFQVGDAQQQQQPRGQAKKRRLDNDGDTTAFITFFQITLQDEHDVDCSYVAQVVARLCGRPPDDPLTNFVKPDGSLVHAKQIFGRAVTHLHIRVVGVGRGAAPNLMLDMIPHSHEALFHGVQGCTFVWR